MRNENSGGCIGALDNLYWKHLACCHQNEFGNQPRPTMWFGILEIAVAIIAAVAIVATTIRVLQRVGLQFSIRDLLWLTLVVALAIGWAVSYRQNRSRYSHAVREMQLEQRSKVLLQEENDTLKKQIRRFWQLSEEATASD
jgi:hypothetical protein